jgi:glucan biosynthesis protein C
MRSKMPLVVLHHSILAYAEFAHFNRRHYLWSTAPIVDHARWVGFDVVVDFNDVYFMSLMFLISGLFVIPSLFRHGSLHYLGGRAVRLGLPFLAAVTVIMPVAYYPSYLQTGADLSFPQYWSGYFTMYDWPGGPAWFIWVLLLFDVIAISALCARAGVLPSVRAMPGWLVRRSGMGLALFLVVAAASYLPMLYVFGPTRWFSLGPLAVQASRVLLYAIFFATGVILGAAGVSHPILQRTGPIARAWPVHAGIGLAAFCGLLTVQIASLRQVPFAVAPLGRTLGAALFVLACVFISLALVGGFIRHLDANRRWLELLAPCAFGIYVVHYAVITWAQTAFLTVEMPAVIKAAMVFATAVLTSWIAVALLRQSRVLRRIL